MAEITRHQLEEVWSHAQEQFGGSTYELASGEFNKALLVDSNSERTEAAYVIKVPHIDTSQARQQLAYEASVIQCINDSSVEAPVEVPRLFGLHNEQDEPAWIALSFIPGNVLPYQEIQAQFSERDLLELGRTVGDIIAWFSKVMDQTTYHKLYHPEPSDREAYFREANAAAIALHDDYPMLGRLNKAFKEDYEWFLEKGLLRPRLIGHDDIRPDNLAFGQFRKRWYPTGLFDFGMAAPSSPEREARHMTLLGRQVGRQALETYYGEPDPLLEISNSTYHHVSAEDIACWWAQAQMVINGIWRMRFGRPLGSIPAKFDMMFASLIDWSELDTYEARPLAR